MGEDEGMGESRLMKKGLERWKGPLLSGKIGLVGAGVEEEDT